MIVIPRIKGEGLVFGDDITLTVIEIRGDKVRLGVELPQGGTVHRGEVYDAILSQKEGGQGAEQISCSVTLTLGPGGSDDAPAKLIELGSQRRGKARPGIVLFLSKLVDLPGNVLRDREVDVAMIAPFLVSGQAITQEVGDLARVVTIAHPVKSLSLIRCQGQGIHG